MNMLLQISNRKEDENNESQSKIGKIKVKLSGDGAKMTRVTSFVILSFSILDDKDSVMSSKGIYYKVYFSIYTASNDSHIKI